MTPRTVTLSVLGRQVEVVCPDEAEASRVRRDWARCLHGGRSEVSSRRIDVSLPPGSSVEACHYALATSVTTRLIDQMVGLKLMFHACGLSTPDGQVLALVAPSGTGKTTAAHALCQSSFGYVTDEALVVGEDLAVDPYPKPLSLIVRDAESLTKVQWGPDALGLKGIPASLRLSKVIVLDRRPTESGARLENLGLIEAMLLVIPQTSGLPSLPKPLQRLARAVTIGGGGVRLIYSEIEDAEPLLIDVAHSTLDEDGALWAPIEPSLVQPIPWRDGHLSLRAFQDAVSVGEEILILVDGVPMHLSGIGATIWSAVGRGVKRSDMVSHVVGAHGEHPDAEALVSATIAALLTAGAVVRRHPQTLAEVMAGQSTDSDTPLPG